MLKETEETDINQAVTDHIEKTEEIEALSTDVARITIEIKTHWYSSKTEKKLSKQGQSKAAFEYLEIRFRALESQAIEGTLDFEAIGENISFVSDCFHSSKLTLPIKIFPIRNEISKKIDLITDQIHSLSISEPVKEKSQFLKSLYFFLLTITDDLYSKNPHWAVTGLKKVCPNLVASITASLTSLCTAIKNKYNELSCFQQREKNDSHEKKPDHGEAEKDDEEPCSPKKPSAQKTSTNPHGFHTARPRSGSQSTPEVSSPPTP